jgi:CRP/FNR family cyclic AMP-dependent transcriptional regulator
MVHSVAFVEEAEHESFFQRLDPRVQEAFLAQGKSITYEPGQTILLEGSITGKLYVLLDGRLKVTHCAHDKHLTLAILRPGNLFGELSMINSLPATADIVAMQTSVVLIVECRDVYSMMQDSSSFMHLFLETLSMRTREVIENVCAIALEDVYGRLRRTLYMLAQEEGGIALRIVGVTHAELAEMVGSSREMISIIMKELKYGDYLRVDGRMITLLKDLPENR